MLEHCYPNDSHTELSLDISFAEADRTAKIVLSCGGLAYDPFTQEDDGPDDGLSITILKNLAKEINYSFINGQNCVIIEL